MKYIVALFAMFVLVPVVRADNLKVSGNVFAEIDYTYSLTGPSFAFHDFQLVDASIFKTCGTTTGLLQGRCDFSASIGGMCNLGYNCGATVDGKDYGFMEGTINLTAKPFLPVSGERGQISIPFKVDGEFFAVDCSPDSVVDGQFVFTDCTKVAPSFGINFSGKGIMTATEFPMGPDQEGITDLNYDWTGKAKSIDLTRRAEVFAASSIDLTRRAEVSATSIVATPEPPTLTLLLVSALAWVITCLWKRS